MKLENKTQTSKENRCFTIFYSEAYSMATEFFPPLKESRVNINHIIIHVLIFAISLQQVWLNF